MTALGEIRERTRIEGDDLARRHHDRLDGDRRLDAQEDHVDLDLIVWADGAVELALDVGAKEGDGDCDG